MPSISGSVSVLGYQVLTNDVLTSAGYGLGIVNPPALPLNPYFGFTFPVLPGSFGIPRFAGTGRKIYRDGVIVFPPYNPASYDFVVIWASPALGLDWYLQW